MSLKRVWDHLEDNLEAAPPPRVRTLQDLRNFTAGNDSFDLEPVSRCDAYRFIEATFRQFDYPSLGKNAAVVRRQFGYGHIPVGFYEDINDFTAAVLAGTSTSTARAGSREKRWTARVGSSASTARKTW